MLYTGNLLSRPHTPKNKIIQMCAKACHINCNVQPCAILGRRDGAVPSCIAGNSDRSRTEQDLEAGKNCIRVFYSRVWQTVCTEWNQAGSNLSTSSYMDCSRIGSSKSGALQGKNYTRWTEKYTAPTSCRVSQYKEGNHAAPALQGQMCPQNSKAEIIIIQCVKL